MPITSKWLKYTVCDKNVAQKSSFRDDLWWYSRITEKECCQEKRGTPYSTAKIRLVQYCAAILATAEMSALSSCYLSTGTIQCLAGDEETPTAADWRAAVCALWIQCHIKIWFCLIAKPHTKQKITGMLECCPDHCCCTVSRQVVPFRGPPRTTFPFDNCRDGVVATREADCIS